MGPGIATGSRATSRRTGSEEVAMFPVPGGTGISHLRAYDWEAPDGVCGGSPHLHLACTEAYVVTGGQGAVQTLSAGGYAETPLEAGVIAWFAPGTVHRMVHCGGLRVT